MSKHFPVCLNIRIDWSELDYFGHVNNVSFFKYIQASRVHYWEKIGLNQYHQINNIGPILASCKCDFKNPLFFPGEVQIYSTIDFIKKTSFGIIHHLYNDQGKIAAIANDVIVMYDFNNHQKIKIPNEIISRIEQLENKNIL